MLCLSGFELYARWVPLEIQITVVSVFVFLFFFGTSLFLKELCDEIYH